MTFNNLILPLYEIHEKIETIEINGETNGTSIRLNNLNNTNNINEPCPRLMETNGRKGAKEKSAFPFVMLLRLICAIGGGIWNQTLGMIREIEPISRAKMAYRTMFLDLILAPNGTKERKRASHCSLEKP